MALPVTGTWSQGSGCRVIVTGPRPQHKTELGRGCVVAEIDAIKVDKAWFDAFADFLINYKPFHFVAQAGVAVGVRFNLDLFIIHTHIPAEIGAQLYLWGPPLAGRVHIDLWVHAFDIPFGAGPAGSESVALYQFYLLVLQPVQKPAAKK